MDPDLPRHEGDLTRRLQACACAGQSSSVPLLEEAGTAERRARALRCPDRDNSFVPAAQRTSLVICPSIPTENITPEKPAATPHGAAAKHEFIQMPSPSPSSCPPGHKAPRCAPWRHARRVLLSERPRGLVWATVLLILNHRRTGLRAVTALCLRPLRSSNKHTAAAIYVVTRHNSC